MVDLRACEPLTPLLCGQGIAVSPANNVLLSGMLWASAQTFPSFLRDVLTHYTCSMSGELEQVSERPLATYSIRGQQVVYYHLTEEGQRAVLSRATPKQRLALLYVSRGLSPAELAERAQVSKHTLET